MNSPLERHSIYSPLFTLFHHPVVVQHLDIDILSSDTSSVSIISIIIITIMANVIVMKDIMFSNEHNIFLKKILVVTFMAAVAPWWSNVATAVVLPARAARWRGVLPESGHYFIIICSSNGHILERNTKEIPETSIWSRESPSPDISSHSHPDIPSWKRIYHHIMLFRWTPDI